MLQQKQLPIAYFRMNEIEKHLATWLKVASPILDTMDEVQRLRVMQLLESQLDLMIQWAKHIHKPHMCEITVDIRTDIVALQIILQNLTP